jgi:hypothetical protein
MSHFVTTMTIRPIFPNYGLFNGLRVALSVKQLIQQLQSVMSTQSVNSIYFS